VRERNQNPSPRAVARERFAVVPAVTSPAAVMSLRSLYGRVNFSSLLSLSLFSPSYSLSLFLNLAFIKREIECEKEVKRQVRRYCATIKEQIKQEESKQEETEKRCHCVTLTPALHLALILHIILNHPHTPTIERCSIETPAERGQGHKCFRSRGHFG
jgi:hypothetical protein